MGGNLERSREIGSGEEGGRLPNGRGSDWGVLGGSFCLIHVALVDNRVYGRSPT